MEFLEVRLQALHDFDGVGHRGFVDIDFLEAAHQRAVFFEILAVFLVGGGADAAQRSLRQSGLQQVGRVHRAAGCRAGADHGVDLVDEENRVLVLLDLLHHLFQALLEIAAVARAREQRAHVEREHRRAGEHFGHFSLDDHARQALGDGRLADAGIAHVKRVVLLPAAKHLNRALHFRLAANQRVDAAIARLLVEIDAVRVQRAFLFLAVGGRLALFARVGRLVLLARPARALRRHRQSRRLGDAMRNIIDRVVARHVLLLEEVGGVAFAFGEDRDEHVGAGDLFAAGGLHVYHRALDDALETGCGLGVFASIGHEVFKLAVDIGNEAFFQRGEIDGARAQDRRGVGVLQQAQQQMLERRVFVSPLPGERHGAVKGLFQIAGEGRHVGSNTLNETI